MIDAEFFECVHIDRSDFSIFHWKAINWPALCVHCIRCEFFNAASVKSHRIHATIDCIWLQLLNVHLSKKKQQQKETHFKITTILIRYDILCVFSMTRWLTFENFNWILMDGLICLKAIAYFSKLNRWIFSKWIWLINSTWRNVSRFTDRSLQFVIITLCKFPLNGFNVNSCEYS